MTALAWLVPVALILGGLGLAAFLWSLMGGQFDDLEGAGWRALDDGPPVKGKSRLTEPLGDVETGEPMARRQG